MNAKTCLSVLFLIFSTAFAAFGQIQVGKSVQISVLGIPAEEKGRIDGNYPVAENGTVNMPFIGAVRASGLRPEALASTLESRYKAAEIYRNPTFQVVADIGEGGMIEAMVHVGGQVRRNGPVKFNRGITLWQAIQAAGGPTEFGTMKRVAILREGKLRSYDVTQTQFMQIPLEPDDNITVPQKRPWEPN